MQIFSSSELLRENKRMLDKSIREIERERQGLQAQEKKLILDIKKSAKQGQMVCYRCLLIVLLACVIRVGCLVFFIPCRSWMSLDFLKVHTLSPLAL